MPGNVKSGAFDRGFSGVSVSVRTKAEAVVVGLVEVEAVAETEGVVVRARLDGKAFERRGRMY